MRLLQEILGSKSKIELLGKILDSEASFSVRELSRLAGVPKSTASLIVDEWGKAGLITAQKVGQTKVIKLNKKFALYKTISGMFRENEKLMDSVLDKIKKSGFFRSREITCLVVFGSLARKTVSGKSDVDILIVTEKQLGENSPLNKSWESLYARLPLIPSEVFLTKKQVIDRLKEKDRFIINVFGEGICLKGSEWFVSAKRTFRNSFRTL